MISVIGAGPVGCYTAYNLAKQGEDVNIFEDNLIVGKPVQCTGVATFTIKGIIKPKKEFVVNKVKKIEVIAPNDSSIKIRLKKEEMILDRTKFDQYLCRKALDENVQLFTGHRFLDYKNRYIIVKDSKNRIRKIKTDILIGADGPNSQVAKSAGLFGERKFFIGAQAKVKVKTDSETYKTYFGSVCPKLFAWFVPESDTFARIGLASMQSPNFYFKKFLERLGCKDIIEHQGGLIPLYNPNLKTQKDNIYLVGDAATQVKATTAGGIIQGLTAANVLVDSILNNKNYESEWKRKLGRELWIHLKLRKILDKFSDEDYNKLIVLMNQKKVLEVLETESRDVPSKLLMKLAIKEPRFFNYVTKLF